VRRSDGQASVELVAVLPFLLVGVLIAVQLAITGWALWSSAGAARAGARAAYVGGDAEAAARSALPAELRREARIEVAERVEVAVEAPGALPGIGGIPLTARARLDPEGDSGG
jgi:pilus assembly protein CpaE